MRKPTFFSPKPTNRKEAWMRYVSHRYWVLKGDTNITCSLLGLNIKITSTFKLMILQLEYWKHYLYRFIEY